MPLQADGEDLGDVTEAIFEAERDAVTVLTPAPEDKCQAPAASDRGMSRAWHLLGRRR